MMTDRADHDPEARAVRRDRRDGERASGTSGAAGGTSGGAPALRAWLAVLALVALNAFVNVTTQMDDARRHGVAVPLSLPLTLEITSAVAAVAVVAIVFAAVRLAPPGRGPLWRTLAVHLAGSLAYSAAHVGLMTLLRTLVFAAAGRTYGWSLRELPYEYRKDLLAYVVIGGVFWLLARRVVTPDRAEAAPAGVARADPTSPATFDIRDGASMLRAPVAEILAAKAAGNYVEFALEDGRRPLMRASMARIEAALGPHGFVRTHRSWLVNGARVRALSATGAGDFRIDLGCGLIAPASRRYPDALARLRGEA
jgi:hypothetical protein